MKTNLYQKSKGKASKKTLEKKAEKNRGRVVWSGKGTYIFSKHGELK